MIFEYYAVLDRFGRLFESRSTGKPKLFKSRLGAEREANFRKGKVVTFRATATSVENPNPATGGHVGSHESLLREEFPEAFKEQPK